MEKYRVGLNLLFWLNFLIFYVVCIYIPIQFVLRCSGHSWTGHFIYIGYAFFAGVIEVVLALYCIKFNITHEEYVHGSRAKRMSFFIKDLFLSQLAKFDVYSDICFVTTVMTCGSSPAIGIMATVVMGVNLLVTAYHVIKLL